MTFAAVRIDGLMTHHPVMLAFVIVGACLVVFAPRKNVRAGRACLVVGSAITSIAMFLPIYRQNLGVAVMIAAVMACSFVLVTIRATKLLSVPGADHETLATIASWWAAAAFSIVCMVITCQSLSGRVYWWVGVTAVLAVVTAALMLGWRDATEGHRLAANQLIPFAFATASTLGLFAVCYLPAYHAVAFSRIPRN